MIYGQGQSQLIFIGYSPPCPEGRYIYTQAESLWNLKKVKLKGSKYLILCSKVKVTVTSFLYETPFPVLMHIHVHVHAKCHIWPLRWTISAQEKYVYNKNRRNLPFPPVFKPHTYKLYMFQRHCTYIVYLYEFTTISRLSMDRQVRG